MISNRKSAQLRELSDKELDTIMKAVGEQVRAQTADQKKKMKISLRQEIDAARAAFLSHGPKRA